jgi:C1A family cysteine protease
MPPGFSARGIGGLTIHKELKRMSETENRLYFGWLHEYPDVRDYSPEHKEIAPLLKKLRMDKPAKTNPPASVDLRQWCSPVEDQKNLGSCTANAAAGIVEYMENKAYGHYIDACRLFIYKTTRDLVGLKGDTGAYLRNTMGALALFGAPPEHYWAYTDQNLSCPQGWDCEPPAFLYALGGDFKALKYFRLDPRGYTPQQVLDRVRTQLAASFPAMFGFTVYNSITQAKTTGKIPYPGPKESVLGGHAVVAVGYDDKMKVTNANGNVTTTGAFLIRNSWGPSWGPNGGYLWMPYDYVLKGLAADWWTLISQDYVDCGQFGLQV